MRMEAISHLTRTQGLTAHCTLMCNTEGTRQLQLTNMVINKRNLISHQGLLSEQHLHNLHAYHLCFLDVI